MKNFRRSLIALLAKQYQQRLLQAVILVQRMKRFRRYLSFLVEFSKELHLYRAAIKIQAYWRGYITRKETNQILNSIRGRLSFYVQSSSNSIVNTLGARIRKSLEILNESVTIPEIIKALIDLERVKRLSPECCLWFTREQAPDILYTYISNCNQRCVPHMDLIKICLRIFINLAKYEKTVCADLEPCSSLMVLNSLIKSNRKRLNFQLILFSYFIFF